MNRGKIWMMIYGLLVICFGGSIILDKGLKRGDSFYLRLDEISWFLGGVLIFIGLMMLMSIKNR